MPQHFIQDPTLPQGFSISFRKRFWSRVNKQGPTIRPDLTPCWTWTGKLCWHGYGQIQAGKVGGNMTSNVASWIINNGPIPKTFHVLHSCDNRSCVNPAHLWLGTQFDNVQDMMRKGRGRGLYLCGEKNPKAKFTWLEIRTIRRLYNSGTHTITDLVKLYQSNSANMCRIVHNKLWKEPDPKQTLESGIEFDI